jgi:mono/diheme cytochrome c family protein
MFAKKCGSCHTLGEGDKTGPDLLGVTKRRDQKWLTTFIRTPGAVIDSGDATANELLGKFKGVRMGDQTLSDEELTGLLGYVDECTTKGGCKLAMGPVKPARDATPADVAAGRALFEGSAPLAAGGPPCISCHNVRGVGLLGGGTLAKDLTHAFARLGEQGTTSALASTPFPLMNSVYVAQPLRDAEAFKIKAFMSWIKDIISGLPPRDRRGAQWEEFYRNRWHTIASGAQHRTASTAPAAARGTSTSRTASSRGRCRRSTTRDRPKLPPTSPAAASAASRSRGTSTARCG